MTQMRCGKKVCHHLNSFQKKSKTSKKKKEGEKKTLCKWTEITQILGLFTHRVGMPNIIHDFFFSLLFHILPVTFFSLLCSCCGLVVVVHVHDGIVIIRIILLWMSRINEQKQNFLFAKFIDHWICFLALLFFFGCKSYIVW